MLANGTTHVRFLSEVNRQKDDSIGLRAFIFICEKSPEKNAKAENGQEGVASKQLVSTGGAPTQGKHAELINREALVFSGVYS